MLRNASSLVKVSLLKAVGTDLLGLCGNEEKKRSVSLDLKLQPQCFFFCPLCQKTRRNLPLSLISTIQKRAAACQQMILPSLILRENGPERNTRVFMFSFTGQPG